MKLKKLISGLNMQQINGDKLISIAEIIAEIMKKLKNN